MKKYVIAIIISLILSIIVTVSSMATRPASLSDMSASTFLSDYSESVLSKVKLTPVNARLTRDLNYFVRGEDAQLYIEGIQEAVGMIIIELQKPLPPDTPYQLFYSIHDSGLNGRNSISDRSKENVRFLPIRLPESDYYDLFRLDIDKNYKIKDISIVPDVDALFADKSLLSNAINDWTKFSFKQFSLAFLILLCESLLIAWKSAQIKQMIYGIPSYIANHKSQLIGKTLIVLTCTAIGVLTWFVLFKTGLSHSKAPYTIFNFVCIGASVGFLIVLRKQFEMYPEKGFLVIAMCIGLMFAVVEPPVAGFSWDGHIHYNRIVHLSYGNEDYITEPERVVSELGLNIDLSKEFKEYSTEYLNSLPYKKKGYDINADDVPYTQTPAYLMAAGAMWLTRQLGFSMSATVIAGRLGNLLCYVIVCYFAIKQLKYGKLFAASLCLTPTVLFLSANYSYDASCIAFILLGICVWLGVYQRPGSKMTGSKAAVMLISFLMGVLVKAVYFPFILITLFLPMDRFGSKKGRALYQSAVVLTAIVLLASFAVPFLHSGGNDGAFNDVRAGNAVNAGSQVAFILKNPVQYFFILMKYLFTFSFKPESIFANGGGCFRAFAYLNSFVVFSDVCTQVLLILFCIAWIISPDIKNHEGEGTPLGVKALACLLAFGSICIAATSLYCAFTPVGADSINGFQERYLLPVLIPLIVILRPCLPLKKSLSGKHGNAVIIYLEAATLIIGMLPFIRVFL